MSLSELTTAGVSTPLFALPHLQRTSLALAVRGGPRYDPPGGQGLTHAAEHLVFRGAGPYPDAAALLSACAELGAEPSAHTLDDALVICWDVEPAAAAAAVALLSEVLLRPRYAGFAAELEVIREELLERLDERGRLTASEDLLREVVFGPHPLGRPVLGDELALTRLSQEAVEAWRARMVQAPNLALAAAGPLSPDAWSAATAALAHVPAGAALPEPAPPSDLGPAIRFLEVGGSQQVEVALGFRGPGRDDPRHPTLEVLLELLDGGPSGPLGAALVDSGLSYDAGAELSSFPDCSLLEIGFVVARHKLTPALEATAATLAGLTQGVPPAALERVRRFDARELRWLRDDPAGLAELLALNALRGLPLDPAHAVAARAKVRAEDVQALAREVFDGGRRVALVLGSLTPSQRRDARRALEW